MTLWGIYQQERHHSKAHFFPPSPSTFSDHQKKTEKTHTYLNRSDKCHRIPALHKFCFTRNPGFLGCLIDGPSAWQLADPRGSRGRQTCVWFSLLSSCPARVRGAAASPRSSTSAPCWARSGTNRCSRTRWPRPTISTAKTSSRWTRSPSRTSPTPFRWHCPCVRISSQTRYKPLSSVH